jgi:hypothetical protein
MDLSVAISCRVRKRSYPWTKLQIWRAIVLESEALNDYLFSQFKAFKPGVVHLALVQLPWDKIYTTNFDLLVSRDR